MPDTLVDLIRHGEPVGCRMIRGNGCDHPLSDIGWAQMRAAAWGAGGQRPWQQVVTSPMARCREFAVEFVNARRARG